MAWWHHPQSRRRPAARSARSVVFEALEPRLLMAGDLPSISMIEADNRGLIILTASANLDASTISNASVLVNIAGADNLFGTGDDLLISRTVTYDANTRQIRIQATVGADVRYRVRLDSSIIKGMDGRALDGEFRGASTISGDGVQGGDLIFFTKRAAETVVRFHSVAGILDVTMFSDRTPLTVQNFLNYANRGVWDQTFIHRSVDNFVIQGGGFFSESPFSRIPQDPSVRNEPGISNLRGTIAMAKIGNQPNSATNEWFFNLGNNSANLDNQNGGFTVFGEVRNAAGLTIMDALAAFELINASAINSAFGELPVIDQDAVLARPQLQIMMEDLIRFTRIALLVDVSADPPQQIDPTGSVTLVGPNGLDGPRIQIYDLDQVGLGDLSSSFVIRYGRNNRIDSITLRDPFPNARIGIYISNATSVGAFNDNRRAGQGDIAFLVSTASIATVRIATAPTGYNLNEVFLPGLSFGQDVDGDGVTNDLTSIFIQTGIVQSLQLPAGVTGDIVMPGGLVTAIIGGTARNADLDLGPSGTGRPTSFTFGSVIDSELRTTDIITSIRAVEWLDTGGRQETIFGALIGALNITGNARQGIPGNFEAGLQLQGINTGRPTLRSVNIAGDIFGSNWIVAGPVGSILIRGNATNFSFGNSSEINSIRGGLFNNVSISTATRINSVLVTDWQGGQMTARTLNTFNVRGDARNGVPGDFTGNLTINGGGTVPVVRTLTIAGSMMSSTSTMTGSVTNWTVRGDVLQSTLRVNNGDLRNLMVGSVVNSTILVQRTLTTLSAIRYENVSLQGGTLDRVISRGDARSGLSGDFTGEVRPTFLGDFSINGNFAGSMNVRSVRNLTIQGDLQNSVMAFSQAASATLRNIEAFKVGGTVSLSEIRSAGRVGQFVVRAMVDSGLYVGAPASLSGLPSSGAGFNSLAHIGLLEVNGLTAGAPAFVNSVIVTASLGTGRIARPQTDNFGRDFGLGIGTLTNTLETRINGSTQRLTSGSNTPAPVGDYQVRLNFMPPAGSTI